MCETQYNALNYIDSVLTTSNCNTNLTNKDVYVSIYEINYYISMTCITYLLFTGDSVSCTISFLNYASSHMVNYTVSDYNITQSVYVYNSLDFFYTFSTPGYYAINASLSNYGGYYSQKMFFVKGLFDVKNVQNNELRLKFMSNAKMNFFRLIYTMDNWISSGAFDIETSHTKNILKSNTTDECTTNTCDINNLCLLATSNLNTYFFVVV